MDFEQTQERGAVSEDDASPISPSSKARTSLVILREKRELLLWAILTDRTPYSRSKALGDFDRVIDHWGASPFYVDLHLSTSRLTPDLSRKGWENFAKVVETGRVVQNPVTMEIYEFLQRSNRNGYQSQGYYNWQCNLDFEGGWLVKGFSGPLYKVAS